MTYQPFRPCMPGENHLSGAPPCEGRARQDNLNLERIASRPHTASRVRQIDARRDDVTDLCRLLSSAPPQARRRHRVRYRGAGGVTLKSPPDHFVTPLTKGAPTTYR